MNYIFQVKKSKSTEFALLGEAEIDNTVTLLSYLTLPALERLFRPFTDSWGKISWTNAEAYPKEAATAEKAWRSLALGSGINRQDCLFLLAQMLGSKDNFTAFLKSFRSGVTSLLQSMIESSGPVNVKKITKSLKYNLNDANTAAELETLLIGPLALFRIVVVPSGISLTLPENLRQLLTTYLGTPRPVRISESTLKDNIPTEDKNEPAVTDAVYGPALGNIDLALRQVLKLMDLGVVTEASKIPVTTAKLLNQYLALPSFPFETSERVKNFSSQRLLASTFSALWISRRYVSDSKHRNYSLYNVAAWLVKSFTDTSMPSFIFMNMMYHLTGITTTGILRESTGQFAKALLDLLKTQQSRTCVWNVEEFVRKVMDKAGKKKVAEFNYYRTPTRIPEFKGCGVAENEFSKFTSPFIRTLLAVLSSFGLVSTEWLRPSTSDSSYVDRIQSFRLTPLGLWALGLTATEPPFEPRDMKVCTLDPDHLFILVPEGAELFLNSLKNFAVPMSESRMAVSEKTFLKGASSSGEIELRLDRFKSMFPKPYSPIWEKFFEKITLRLTSLHQDSCYYMALELNPENRELMKFVQTDETLQEYIVRGESFRIFYPSYQHSFITSLFARAGFFIEQ